MALALKMQNSYIFIAGLHKSGTSILAQVLGQHPDISVFNDTGFPKDEGQFLQTVFPIAKEYGGPGKFGFSDEMHLTEQSPIITPESKKQLYLEWHKYWGADTCFYLEKSPPNILKTRFLQHFFPGACFFIITRHPVAVSYATRQWSKTSILELIDHWVKCHLILQNDLKYLEKYLLFKYEDFVCEPSVWIDKAFKLIGVQGYEVLQKIYNDTNQKYFDLWERDVLNNNEKLTSISGVLSEMEQKINMFGYSLFDLP